jgi:hypothetical protein
MKPGLSLFVFFHTKKLQINIFPRNELTALLQDYNLWCEKNKILPVT